MDRRKFIKTLGKTGLAVVASAIPGCENNYDNLEFIIKDHNPAVKKPVIEKTEKLNETAVNDNLETNYNPEITPANKILRSLEMNKLPGTGKLDVHETPGAKYCLLHIKQKHARFGKDTAASILKEFGGSGEEDFFLKLIRDKWNSTNKIQKDIYSILEGLRVNYGVKEIRAESFSKEYSKEQLKEFYKNRLEAVLRECYATPEEWIANSEKYIFAPGAELLMGMQGKLRVLQGENEELNRKAVAETKKPFSQRDESLIYTPREDFLVKISANGKNPFIVGVYGAQHEYLDNIERWNRNNPDKKFSLAVAIPRAYINNN